MDVAVVKVVVIGVVMLGAFVITPVVMALLSHQQKMAQLFARQSLDQTELLRRLEILEQRLSADKPLPPQTDSQLRANLEAEQIKRSS